MVQLFKVVGSHSPAARRWLRRQGKPVDANTGWFGKGTPPWPYPTKATGEACYGESIHAWAAMGLKRYVLWKNSDMLAISESSQSSRSIPDGSTDTKLQMWMLLFAERLIWGTRSPTLFGLACIMHPWTVALWSFNSPCTTLSRLSSTFSNFMITMILMISITPSNHFGLTMVSLRRLAQEGHRLVRQRKRHRPLQRREKTDQKRPKDPRHFVWKWLANEC